MQNTNNPIAGMRYLLRGAGLLVKPGVRRYVVIPLAINVVLFGSLIGLGVNQFESLLAWLMPDVPDWLQWLAWLLWVVFAAATLLIVFYTFTLVANFVSAPFNGFLAEAVEKHLRGGGAGAETTPLTATTLLQTTKESLMQELQKMGYLASRAVPVLLLFLIPGINVFAPLIWLLFGAWMLALEYVAFPMENHSIRFSAARTHLREKRLLALGFGGAVLTATMIPLVNFLVIPAAVAGATALWVEQLAERAPSVSRAG